MNRTTQATVDFKLFLAHDGFKGTDVAIVPVKATESLTGAVEYISASTAAGDFNDMGEAYKTIISDGINAIAASIATEDAGATQQPIEVQLDPTEREQLEAIRAATGASYSEVLAQAMIEGLRVQRTIKGE
jgi:hypothetical protein